MTEFLVWAGSLFIFYLLILLCQFTAKAGEKLFNAVQHKWKVPKS